MRVREYNHDMSYRIYVSDCLRMITENTANIRGGHYMQDRFYDRIYPNTNNQKNKPSGKEIADNIIGGLTGKGK